MPKAWLAEDLRPDMPLGHAAGLMLAVKWPEVQHYESAARTGKVAGIHDMRVACKRLREALRVLRPALPRDSRRKLLPVVEELNDALGEVRDRDVLRQAFKRMMREDDRLADLKPLRRSLAKERSAHHRKLLHMLEGLKRSGFGRKYERLMAELEAMNGDEPTVVGQFAVEAIGDRLQDVMDNLHAITGRYRSSLFHRQRIRVKKLKYALEPFLPILPAEADELYGMVSELQELMGLVHDLDVQREVVADWVVTYGLSDGLRLTLQQIARRRRDLLAQTRGHVKAMAEQECEARLQQVLRALADQTVARQAAT